LTPNQELVGTIERVRGRVDIFVERVEQPGGELVWLFSSQTLEWVPQLYQETVESRFATILPRFLTSNRIGGIRVAEWLAIVFGLPVFYFATVLLNRILTPLIGRTVHYLFRQSSLFTTNVLPRPARLLLLALASRWLLASLPLSLLVRQFWSNIATLVTIGAAVWLLILLNGEAEQYIRRRFPGANVTAAVSLLRLGRRMVDVLIIFAGLLAILRHFGVDPTPVLAGLGVGGIAVALAAQKTLENVIAGASLIFDQAVRVGDFLKMGDVQGTVDHIGLRSTRIRTLDRTVVSVPNGLIANMSLETFSVRDKFWFHPVVGLQYETTPKQLREVTDGIHRLLAEHRSVDRESIRVRFLRLGAFSLDVDIFAYVAANDWSHFLEIQELLLFGVTDIVEKAGTKIAFPSQTMYMVPSTGGQETVNRRSEDKEIARSGKGTGG
jgi:MscS family membrane protein